MTLVGAAAAGKRWFVSRCGSAVSLSAGGQGRVVHLLSFDLC